MKPFLLHIVQSTTFFTYDYSDCISDKQNYHPCKKIQKRDKVKHGFFYNMIYDIVFEWNIFRVLEFDLNYRKYKTFSKFLKFTNLNILFKNEKLPLNQKFTLNFAVRVKLPLIKWWFRFKLKVPNKRYIVNSSNDTGIQIYYNTVKPRNLLILGLSKIVPQIAKSADCECYCM